MTSHAFLPPSAAARWLRCQGSLFAEDEREPGAAALRGTRLHDIACRMLTGGVLKPSEQMMARQVKPYVDFVKRESAGAGVLLVEATLRHPHWGDWCFGTVDAAWGRWGEVHVVDLKTGSARVRAEENVQLGIYALLARAKPMKPFNAKRFFLHVHQNGQADSWEAPVDWLDDLERRVTAIVNDLRDGGYSARYQAGPWCRWCPAVSGCRTFDLDESAIVV